MTDCDIAPVLPKPRGLDILCCSKDREVANKRMGQTNEISQVSEAKCKVGEPADVEHLTLNRVPHKTKSPECNRPHLSGETRSEISEIKSAPPRAKHGRGGTLQDYIPQRSTASRVGEMFPERVTASQPSNRRPAEKTTPPSNTTAPGQHVRTGTTHCHWLPGVSGER